MELTLDQALQKGIEAHQAGKVQEADRYYTAILKANPKHPDANHNMGVLAVDVGKVQEALPFFKTAIEVNTKVSQFWVSYIDALIKLGRPNDAKIVLDEAKRNGAKGNGIYQIEKTLFRYASDQSKTIKDKDPSQIQLQPILDLFNKRKLKKVLEEVSKLLLEFPNSVILYNLKGATNARLELQDEAIKDFQKALKINPGYIQAYNNMGASLKEKGKLEEAIQAFKRALSIKPDYADACNNLAIALQNTGQYQEAIRYYKKAVLAYPNFAEAYNNMGTALSEENMLDEAIDAYQKALSAKPNFAEAYNNLGNSLRRKCNKSQAIDAYQKALSIKPDYAEAFNNMGIVLQDIGQINKAIEAYKKAVSIKPDYAEAFNDMGNIYKSQGKFKEAIDAYKRAKSIKPSYGNANHMLSSLMGETTETAPRDYVENLFNRYSKNFEASLVGDLKYKTPKLIKDILIKRNNKESLGSVLDLGCGTGLLGPEIKNHCSRLEGIDLSSKMLDLAKQKNVYDKLSHSDILEFLSSKPLDFDYYIALDVFIYVGELTEIFRLIKSRNKKPGKLVFSTEHNELDGYHLLKTGRYSHSKTYIESLCKKFDYNIAHFSTTDLRKEKEDFLTGGIYVINFPQH